MIASGLTAQQREGWPLLRAGRLGVVANQTAIDRRGRPLWALLAGEGLPVQILLSPEHGLWGEEQDMIPVDPIPDPLTGLPVRSLYGREEASLDPDPEALEDLDALVFDIQDVGSRYYTYQATLHRILRTASGTGLRICVLDRPNPIGLSLVEGLPVAPHLYSFVGQAPLLHRHGMTMGELARFLVRVEALDVDLHVAQVEGWDGEGWSEAWEPWVPPSPNMPTPDTALLYPGACLMEGTNLSEGRGTTTPFQLLGAPWLDRPELTADALNAEGHPGVLLRPCRFRPTFQKWAGESCGGLAVHVTDREAFRPLRFYLRLIQHLRRTCEGFRWRAEAYEFVSDRPAIDLLLGDDRLRKWMDEPGGMDKLEELLAPAEDEFTMSIDIVRLYPRKREGA